MLGMEEGIALKGNPKGKKQYSVQFNMDTERGWEPSSDLC